MNVTIIGTGHIGGSLAIGLKENGFAQTVIGIDRNQNSLDKALRRRIIDRACTFSEGIELADLIIVSTPVDVVVELLPRVLDQVSEQVVIDVGSTKETILAAVSHHPKRKNFVATHPMAGTEHAGIESAVPDLFTGKYTVLCNTTDSSAEAVKLTEDMYRSLQMKIACMEGAAHDVHTAYVSHISHISSFALALTVLEKEKDENQIFKLASSGFSSTVRLAKSSPSMWTPIFRQNRDNVLDVLDEHINILSQFRSLLIKKDFEQFHRLMEDANRIRQILG